MTKHILIILLLAICHECQCDDDDGCSYTFQVSKSQMGQMCSRSVENEDIENLKKKVDILEQIVKTQQRQIDLSESDEVQDDQRQLTLDGNAYEVDPDSVLDEETDFSLRGTSSSKRRGVNYIRYGHRGCAKPARLVYDGFVGKSYYTHGGGSNYLCLPRKPDWLADNKAGFQSHSYIYGVEYEVINSPSIPSAVHDQDVPCAVCESLGRSQKLMIPAKKTCPIGWKQEYRGMLMSERYSHRNADFVCVDMAFQAINGGSGSKNGGLLYAVEAKCGSLPCPPYDNGNELACVVCSK